MQEDLKNLKKKFENWLEKSKMYHFMGFKLGISKDSNIKFWKHLNKEVLEMKWNGFWNFQKSNLMRFFKIGKIRVHFFERFN